MVGLLTAERASIDVGAALRRRRWLPVTTGYALLLTVITLFLSAAHPDVQDRVIARTSTNLHNLLGGHLSTLFSSAFVLGDTDSALLDVPLLACLLALAELRFGPWSTVRVFLAGHVGATVLVAVGLWAGVAAGWLPASIGDAEDVGISYGAMGVFGAFVALVPERWRIGWAMVWLLIAIEGVEAGRTFTNVGHLVSYSIGLAVGTVMIHRGVVARRRLTWIDTDLLACAAFLASTFLTA
jgi:hypothetical protein